MVLGALTCPSAFQWQLPVRHIIQQQIILPTQSFPCSFNDIRQRSTRCFSPSFSCCHVLRSAKKEIDSQVEEEGEEEFLRKRLAHLESLEEILDELEEYDLAKDDQDEEEVDEVEVDEVLWDEGSLAELLASLPDEGDEEEYDVDEEESKKSGRIRESAAAGLELALLQGVVPVSAGVGSETIPGDFGFDPLNLATKDYPRQVQSFLLNLLPPPKDEEDTAAAATTVDSAPRPSALILRDYREAEIRHGRLAMLAAIFWPLQEMLDRLLLDEDQFGPLIYGPVTLPYFPLLMTAIMMLLGYLDIYSQAIKDRDEIGEAFLPGDCFWDPLRILQGAPDSMKRNMQERELFNGRVAMLAFAVYTWEEAITHLPLISIEGNELLLQPAYQVPFIQQWLDNQFSVTDPEWAFFKPVDIGTVESLKDILEETVLNNLN